MRGLVASIAVDHQKAVITGPKAATAAAITAGAVNGGVRTFVRKWRAGQDEDENWTVVIRRDFRRLQAKAV